MKYVFVAIAALSLAACTQTTDPKKVWLRVDGQSVRGNPKLQQQGEIDWTICKGETQKAAVGMAPIYYRGIAGAVSAGIVEGQRQEALTDVAKGCMAERGYVLATEEEAQARRAAYEARLKRRPAS